LIPLLGLGLLLSCGCASKRESAPQRQVYKDGAFTEIFRRTTGLTAGDGGFSIPLSDGRVLWLFGDSHVDDFDGTTQTLPCLFQVRNAALVQPAGNSGAWQTLVGNHRGFRSLFKYSENDEEWCWPVNGFQQGQTVYVYLTALRKTGKGGMWGFESIGHDYWAKLKFPDLTVNEYVPLPGFNGISFGAGFVRERDGYTYAFGGKQKGLGSEVFVARFNSNSPEKQWSFWDGNAWNPSPTNAVAIAQGSSTSVHICKIKDRFLLTTSEFSVACDQGKRIFTSTSRSPTGPFSSLKAVFAVDELVDGHWPFFYLPVAHPELINRKNELLITYSINGYEPCIPICKDGRLLPDSYRLRAIRVPLAELGIP
jgi:hypothetical protein